MRVIAKIDWQKFEEGMAAARQVPDVALQATAEEASRAGGPDFLGEDCGHVSASWHLGFDHAVLLARGAHGHDFV